MRGEFGEILSAGALFLLSILAGSTVARCPAPTHKVPGSGVKVRRGENRARTVLTYEQLFGRSAPSSPVDDTAGFAVPIDAAEPSDFFEGTLILDDPAKSGSFTLLSDVFGLVPSSDSPWRHLPPFRFQFVQSGGHLIPVEQGLAITGSPTWNYIIGPGRVWGESSDRGYLRASLPFSIVQRNQNCVHNGEMTFLFGNGKSPNISSAYYQITQETCYPMKFNMWGIVSATYNRGGIPEARKLKEEFAAELSHRMPSKPIRALVADFLKSGVNLAAFAAAYKHPENITTYGLVMNGTNYVAGCQTRFGQYAFCSDMRVPSYSIAKSIFAGVALMRLGQLYGRGVYSELIKNYSPQYSTGGNWGTTTFGNTSDMATGNYNLDGYEADEDSPTMDKFLVDESYDSKILDAFAFKQHFVEPGTKWIYQSSATFLLTQAMNIYVKQRQGSASDLFNMVRDDIYIPLRVSAGGLTTIRTDNSSTGAPSGYYGLFLDQDDIAKIANFLNNEKGVLGGRQVLEPSRLEEALFRASNSSVAGVPILGHSHSSVLGSLASGQSESAATNGRRYAHGFWGRHITSTEFPEYSCSFWLSFMAGYGGNIVALLPNGTTFYIFSDGMEFPWTSAVHEINKLAPMCN
jgi:hypothetical protein